VQSALLIAAAPAVIGAPLIEIWRRRTVRAWNNEQWYASRRRELREALEGEYQPEYEHRSRSREAA
jgi:hypothetical protein